MSEFLAIFRQVKVDLMMRKDLLQKRANWTVGRENQ